MWENFGPLHVDRCDAVATELGGQIEVIGLELAGKSNLYEWVPASGVRFKKITIFEGTSLDQVPLAKRLFKTLLVCLSQGKDAHFFMCHYDHPMTFIVSSLLRLSGHRVYAMGCSKFDDYPRYLWREVLKTVFYFPYCGAIASGTRSRDYMRFLGLAERDVKPNYNAVSLSRVLALAGSPPAPEGLPYGDRHFVIVARFVPKKNLRTAIKAFALYAGRAENPRSMHICGTGPLEDELKQQVRDAGIEHLVNFSGFLQSPEVFKTFSSSLALVLPSIEEQFGNVIPEALGMGLPVIVSDNCGARDLLVRTGVNGFVVEPDNHEGMALFMRMLAEDESLWARMCRAAQQFAERADAAHFAESASALMKVSRWGR